MDKRELFEDIPSLKAIAQDKDTLQKVWKLSVRALLGWLKLPPNKALVVSHFKDKLPTEKDFPQECPYTFQQVME